MAVNGSRYFSVTIDHNQVPNNNQNGFPVYLDLSDLGSGHGFWSNVDPNGDDIRVVDSGSQAEVPFEVVSVDTTNNTGEIHFKGDLSHTSDTEFLVYYDSSDQPYDPTGSYGRDNVWTDYLAVWHMDQDPSSTNQIDSTGNGYDLSAGSGLDSSNLVDSKIGRGIRFDRTTNDYLLQNNWDAIDGNPSFSITLWEQTNGSTDNYAGFFHSADLNGNGHLQLGREGSNPYLRANTDPGRVRALTGNAYDDSWHLVALTYSGGSSWTAAPQGGGVRMYTDASEVDYNTDSNGTPTINPGNLYVGKNNPDTPLGGAWPGEFNGVIDELRLASIVFDSWRLQTEYNNQNSPSSFYTLSSEVTLAVTIQASFGISQTNQVSQNNKATSGASVSVDQQSTIQEGSAASADDALSLSQLSTILDSSKVSATANINIDSVQSIDSNGIATIQATLSQALVNAINSDGSKLITASFSVSSQSIISQSNKATTDGSVNLSMQTVFSVLSNAFASTDISMSSVQSFMVVGNTAKVTLTDGRTLTIKLENRTITPEKENRTNTVPGSKSRKMKIDKEDRTVKIDEENRSSGG